MAVFNSIDNNCSSNSSSYSPMIMFRVCICRKEITVFVLLVVAVIVVVR